MIANCMNGSESDEDVTNNVEGVKVLYEPIFVSLVISKFN